MRSANGTLVILHAHNLTAVNTQAHVAAWQYDSVFLGRVAHNTLALGFIIQVGLIGSVAVYIIQVHDLIVVQ